MFSDNITSVNIKFLKFKNSNKLIINKIPRYRSVTIAIVRQSTNN